MFKLIATCLSVLVVSACGADDNLYRHLISGAIDDGPQFNKKAQVLPASYVECNNYFHWNTSNFFENAFVPDTLAPGHSQKINLTTPQKNFRPYSTGSGSVNNFELNELESQNCFDIERRLRGETLLIVA